MSAFEIEREGAIVTIRLNRPEHGNALTDADMLEPLIDAISEAGHSAGTLVLTGAGRVFSAGGNIDDIALARGMFGGTPGEIRDGYRNGIHRLVTTLYDLEIPTIAAVNGAAVGAGFDLTLACDMRIASDSARFQTGFVGLGLIPGDGGAWLLRAAVGPAVAARLILTSEMIPARAARELGLVSDVVADDALLPAAMDLAARTVGHSRTALGLAKRLLRRAATQGFAEALEDAASAQAICHHSTEHRKIAARLARERGL